MVDGIRINIRNGLVGMVDNIHGLGWNNLIGIFCGKSDEHYTFESFASKKLSLFYIWNRRNYYINLATYGEQITKPREIGNDKQSILAKPR
jgi:hypothetical protein